MVDVTQHSGIYTDFQGLTKLKTAAKNESPESLKAVAQQFEAIFIQMLLKSMRDASLGDDLLSGNQSDVYKGMFDQQMSLTLSKRGNIGIADMLVKQLSRQPAEGGDQALPGHNPLVTGQLRGQGQPALKER